jgi:hypothetical protein
MGSVVKSRDVAVLLFGDVEVLDFAGPFEVGYVAARVVPCGWATGLDPACVASALRRAIAATGNG